LYFCFQKPDVANVLLRVAAAGMASNASPTDIFWMMHFNMLGLICLAVLGILVIASDSRFGVNNVFFHLTHHH
jgi:hypothetical protein